ncbi:TPA: SDR family NAD(P)-dependent oxidoreductase [Pseudomonas aeruginosa]
MSSESNFIPNPARFSGRVALVTGAGSGIGRAAALRFAREGAAVVLVGRREQPLSSVAQEIEKAGGQACVVPTDISDEAAVDALIGRVLERFGRLDFAFNNAGVLGALKPIVELSCEDFDTTMATNLRGVWLLLRAEIRAMLDGGRPGAIVNTSSFVAEAASVGTSVYAASKAALDAMIRALALEVGPAGIRINNVAPGLIRTPMNADLDETLVVAFSAHAALKRAGTPADVGDVAVWLCSDDARFVTGQTLLVDGGVAIPGLR